MAEYESRKKRWMLERKMLVLALCVLICVLSTKGISTDLGDRSLDSWEFALSANSKQIKYDFCKYNGTSTGMQCKNLMSASIDFEKVCNCTIQHDETNDGSLSFDLHCKSNLTYCPKELTVTYRQGSNATAPHQVPSRRGIGDDNNESPGNPPGPGIGADAEVTTSGMIGWLAFIISNVIWIILFKEKVHDFLTEMWNRLSNSIMDRGQLPPFFHRNPAPRLATGEEPDIDSTETPLRELTGNTPQVPIPRGTTSAGIEMGEPIESLDFSESDERGDTHIRPEGVANLGFFESEIDGRVTRQNADNVCVLVIHYDFKNDPNKIRSGHKRDINNLKTSFGENRNCNFRNLSPNKETLLQLLGDQEELLQFFNTQDDVPSVFVLFILSHGEENGKILTDHLDRETNEYEFFTTDEVFDSLQKLKKFEKCLKVVNFGPSRGSLLDSMFNEKIQNERYENRNSYIITSRPRMHNHVVFYSMAERTMANTNKNGSWFVTFICLCLDNADDEPLLKFFTTVQNRMHQTSRNYWNLHSTPLEQTPELKMFTQDRKFIISKLKIPAKAISNTDGYGNLSKVSNEYFSWKSDEGQHIRGRIGFILSVVRSRQVQEMTRVLQNLDFEIRDWKLSAQSVKLYTENVSELEPDVGCIMTCIFGPVCENQEKEVCVRVGQETRPITDILHSLVGPRNDKLIGKPKILIVVNVEAPQTDGISADMKELQVSATNQSGWLVLILKCKDAFEKLIELFGNVGEKSLQELLEPLLTRESKWQDKVLLNSTMQYLIKFPIWPRAFVKPDFKLKKTQIHPDQMDNSKHSIGEKINFDTLLKMAKSLFEENKNSIESPIRTVSHPHVSSDIESSKKSDLIRDSAARNSTDASIVWLFNSVAGAGKSTVLKEMAHQLSRFDERFKILQIPLKKYDWYLREMPALKMDEIKFLAKTTGNSCFDINNWIEKREVIVFLDGFDEVCPDFREKIMKIVNALNNARVPLFIGTRPHEVHHIQERMENSTIVEIEPLDEAKQIEFLQIVARRNQEEIEQLMNIFKDQDILGNPLYLTLLTEYKGDGNLYEIFDKIVRRKVEICLKRENGGKDVGDETIEKSLKFIQLVASRFVTGVKIDQGSVTKEELEKINAFGVVTYFNEQVNFTHQTFAEFLTAQKFLYDLKNPVAEEVPLFNEELVQCRKFVDLFFFTEKGKDSSYAEALMDCAKFTDPVKLLKQICRENLSQMFKLLNLNLSLKDKDGKNALHLALHHLEMVKMVHGKNRKLATETTNNGENCLHLAIADEKCSEEVAIWLLKNTQVDKNAMTKSTDTPLLLACKRKKWEVVRLLVFAGVDVNTQDSCKRSALHYLAAQDETDPEIIQMLLEYGANVHLQDEEGSSALHLAKRCNPGREEFLLKTVAKVNAREMTKKTDQHDATTTKKIS